MRAWTSIVVVILSASVVRPASEARAQTVPVCSPAKPCAITWTANTEPDMKEYRVYLSPTSGLYGAPALTVPHPTTESRTSSLGVLTDRTYFLVVTAVDQDGNESGFSNEVSFRFDGPPSPPQLTITVTVP